jgi:hypothetical protein
MPITLSGVAGEGQRELRHGAGRSVRHWRQADDGIIGDGGDGLKRHVAGALDGPLVVLLEEDGADQAGDCGLVGEVPTTSVRRLISPFTRSSGLVIGISSSVPRSGRGVLAMVYGATIRDRGTGSTMVRAGRCIG